MTTEMKAIRAKAYGGPEVFEWETIAIPQPKEDQVFVRIHYSTVTRADTMMRTGKPYIGRLFNGLQKPKHPIPGTGFSGIVTAIGDKVTSFVVGDAVFGETALEGGTNAEYVCLSEKGVLLHKPEELPFEEAATFTDGPLTSYNFLMSLGQLEAGQKVLINGASGSLGTAAVQIAKANGAVVVGVCSTRNVGLVSALGADQVIDYHKTPFSALSDKYDLIFDTVGKISFAEAKRKLQPQGLYVSPVLSFQLLRQMAWTSMKKGPKAKFAATGLRNAEELKAMLQSLLDMHRDGKLEVVIDRQFPLEKVAEAHTYVDTGRKRGNLIITHSNLEV